MGNYDTYFKEIGMNDVQINRSNEMIEFAIEITGITPLDITVSEAIDEKKERVYKSLWLFDDKYCAECKNFLHSIQVDKMKYKDIYYFNALFEDCSPKNLQTENGRLFFEARNPYDMVLQINALKNNVKYLYDIFQKYFKKADGF
jgi:hypothetical protein